MWPYHESTPSLTDTILWLVLLSLYFILIIIKDLKNDSKTLITVTYHINGALTANCCTCPDWFHCHKHTKTRVALLCSYRWEVSTEVSGDWINRPGTGSQASGLHRFYCLELCALCKYSSISTLQDPTLSYFYYLKQSGDHGSKKSHFCHSKWREEPPGRVCGWSRATTAGL